MSDLNRIEQNNAELRECIEIAESLPDACTHGENTLNSFLSGTITDVTAEDLAGVTEIRGRLFNRLTSLESITIPESVTKIGEYAFYFCTALKEMIIPDSVTSIGEHMCDGCHGLEYVKLSKSLGFIQNYAFNNCRALKTIEMPPTMTSSIGQFAFYECNALEDITIPEGCTSIGTNAFYRCTSLKSLTIPKTVKSIGGWNSNMIALKLLDLTAYTEGYSFPSLGSYSNFSSYTFEIRVVAGRKAELAAMTNWSALADKIVEV